MLVVRRGANTVPAVATDEVVVVVVERESHSRHTR